MAIVLKNGVATHVKNLGWLLRHAYEVQYISFWCHQDDCQDVSPFAGMRDRKHVDCSGELTATLQDGTEYRTNFASYNVFRGWVQRPVFGGVEVWINHSNGDESVFIVGEA